MRKSKSARGKEGLLPEYDFSKGERGRYAKRYAAGTNLVLLDPDVAKAFPDSKSVNHVLRTLVALVKRQSKPVHS